MTPLENDTIGLLPAPRQDDSGNVRLRSTLFVLDKSGSEPPYTEYSFAGGGWGHGVGMSQAGAIDMARRGLSYRVILRHYYGDAELARLG